MAKDIIIDASQYTNLQTTYSEKNNIDNIKGTEYRVTGIETIDFRNNKNARKSNKQKSRCRWTMAD